MRASLFGGIENFTKCFGGPPKLFGGGEVRKNPLADPLPLKGSKIQTLKGEERAVDGGVWDDYWTVGSAPTRSKI